MLILTDILDMKGPFVKTISIDLTMLGKTITNNYAERPVNVVSTPESLRWKIDS